MAKFVKITGTGLSDVINGSELRDKIKARGGNDVIAGAAGADRIKAGKGDDAIQGNGGNDDIDGGGGVDVALYEGRFDQYLLSFKRTGDLKGTVTDLVADRDGTDSVKSFEFLQFQDAIYDIANDTVYILNNAPSVAHPIADQSVLEDHAVSFTFAADTFEDLDGDTLTYSASLADGNALPSWLQFDAMMRTFSGTPPANFAGILDVRVIASDGTASVSDEFQLNILPVNDLPTGGVVITGSVVEDETLVAAQTLSDADGLGTIGYQWQRDTGTGFEDILGAVNASYTLGDADVGAQIRVIASYVDGGGSTETVVSDATAAVANVDDEPTGSVVVIGSAVEDQTLFAVHTLSDADGLGVVGYQWQRNTGTGFEDIAGAVDASYTLGDADVGAQIRVIASYVDGGGSNETVASDATAAVADVNDAPDTAPTSANGLTDELIAVSLSGSDIDGNVAFFRITNPPITGTLFSDAAGTMPAIGDILASGQSTTVYFRSSSAGLSSFQFAAVDNDGAIDASPATAEITLTVPNQAPVGFADSYSIAEASHLVDTTLLVDAAHGVLSSSMFIGDHDPDGGPQPLTAVLVSGPSHAMNFEFNADGSFTYQPEPYYLSYTSDSITGVTFSLNYSGPAQPDTFVYRAFDGAAYSDPVTVSITVTPPPLVHVNPSGYDMQGAHDPITEPMGKFYDDLALGGLSFTQIPGPTVPVPMSSGFRVITGNGVTYDLYGSDLTYDPLTGMPNGGTLGGRLEILNPAYTAAGPTPLTLLSMLNASTGPAPAWQFAAADFVQSLDDYSLAGDRSGLDAIFQNVRYSIVGAGPVGWENDVIVGGQFDDSIAGAAGNDVIYSGPGNDFIIPGAGAGPEHITGGEGSDWFQFGHSDGINILHDFSGAFGPGGENTGQRDIIDLRAVLPVTDINGFAIESIAHTFEDILERATQDGGDTVIDLGHPALPFPDQLLLRLENFQRDDLRPEDFLYQNFLPSLMSPAPLSTNEDSPLTIATPASVGWIDWDNDQINFTGVAAPGGSPGSGVTLSSGATVGLVGGQITYDPTPSPTLQALNPGASYVDSLSLAVADSFGATSSATVNITVSGLAEPINGSFESDLAGWSTIGTVQLSSASVGGSSPWPTEGTQSARINSGGASQSAVESFLGLSPGILDTFAGNATCGSAMKTTVHLQAGQKINFDWVFASVEDNSDFQNNDFSFFTMQAASAPGPASASKIISFFDSAVSVFRNFADLTSATTTHQFNSAVAPADGDYVVGIGTMNVTNCAVQSAIFVDDFLIV